ncbi:hypothetical protein [Streptomyces sp. NPDC057623]|uniref:hypothetical protein n=1 Tax=Streptomyces sp. NPDC057623 TaxID=3346187 RepID=UPI00369B8AF5
MVAQVSKTTSMAYDGSGVARACCHQARRNASIAAACSGGHERQSTRVSPCAP